MATVDSSLGVVRMSLLETVWPRAFGHKSPWKAQGVSSREKDPGDLHWEAWLSQPFESFCAINLQNSILKVWDSIKLAYKNKNMVTVKMR